MRFYVVTGRQGETVGCETSEAKARSLGARKLGRQQYEVELITITMPAKEAIRRLLGQRGGYAEETETVVRFK